jgi:hypothetical protein
MILEHLSRLFADRGPPAEAVVAEVRSKLARLREAKGEAAYWMGIDEVVAFAVYLDTQGQRDPSLQVMKLAKALEPNLLAHLEGYAREEMGGRVEKASRFADFQGPAPEPLANDAPTLAVSRFRLRVTG